jgi:3D (Asp-Asp-Asp) domain-containing protein
MRVRQGGLVFFCLVCMLGSVAAGGEQRRVHTPPPTRIVMAHQPAREAPGQRLQVTVGAYSPRRQETQGNPRDTASGEQVRTGVIALSPDVGKALGVTFGDRIVVAGLGTYVFQDRVASHKRRHVDLFMESTAAARRFGQRRTFVTVAAQE